MGSYEVFHKSTRGRTARRVCATIHENGSVYISAHATRKYFPDPRYFEVLINQNENRLGIRHHDSSKPDSYRAIPAGTSDGFRLWIRSPLDEMEVPEGTEWPIYAPIKHDRSVDLHVIDFNEVADSPNEFVEMV